MPLKRRMPKGGEKGQGRDGTFHGEEGENVTEEETPVETSGTRCCIGNQKNLEKGRRARAVTKTESQRGGG